MNSLLPIIGVVFLAGVGVLGDYFIKLSGSGSQYISISKFIVGMFLYALTALGWFFVMKEMKLGILGIFYSVTTAVLLVIVGVVFFKEHLSIYDITGIILGIISIILLSRFG